MIVLLATAILTFMSTVDMSIVNTALPQIAKELMIPMNETEWIASSYLIVVCMLLIIFGRIGDQLSRTFIFQCGTIVFITGSLICGFSIGLPILIGARIIQAIGSAMIMANSFGIITDLFPKEEHGRALAANSVFAQIGNVSGPAIAGFILTFFSWHWLFLINLPIGIIAFGFGRAVFPKQQINWHHLNIDWLGFISFAIAILTAFLAVYIGQVIGYVQLPVIVLVMVAVTTITAFIIIEQRVQAPLLKLSLFKRRRFSFGIIITILVFIVGYFNSTIMPFYMQERLGFAPVKMSLFFMIISAVNVFSAPLGGYFSDKIGPIKISFGALIVLLISSLMLTIIQPQWSILILVLAFTLFGLGNGLFQNNPIIMDSVGKSDRGIAGSIAALSRNIGFTVGLTVSTTLLYLGMSTKAGHQVTDYPTHHPDWFIFGMHFSYAFTILFVVIGLILMSKLMWSKRE